MLAESSRERAAASRMAKGPVDPNAFALEVRQLLGRERRVVDIWNGITVLAAPYEEPKGRARVLTVLNYAHQPLPVQMRVRGNVRGGSVPVSRGRSHAAAAPPPRRLHGIRAAGAADRRTRVPDPCPLSPP